MIDPNSSALEPYMFMTATIVGKSTMTNFVFEPHRDHRFCRICGAVFQSDLDRLDSPTDADRFGAKIRRDEWAVQHAKLHTDREHRQLALSGRFLTPEATEVLAPYGIIPLTDMVVSDEHAHAGAMAKRQPAVDAIDSVRVGSQ